MFQRILNFFKKCSWFNFLTLVIALIGGVPGACEIKTKYFDQLIKIEINDQLSRFVGMDTDNQNKEGKICFTTRISLVGLTEKPTTPKSIHMFIKVDNQWIEGVSIKVKYTLIKGNKYIVFSNNKDQMVEKIDFFTDDLDSKSITIGVPKAGYIFFMFDKFDTNKLKLIKFVVTDYYDKVYMAKFSNKAEYFDLFSKNFDVIDNGAKLSSFNLSPDDQNSWATFDPYRKIGN